RSSSGGRSFSSLGSLLGFSGFTLQALLARLCLVRVVRRRALEEASGVEEASDAVGRLCTGSKPVLATVQVELHAVFVVLLEHRIEGADLLDVAAVARRGRLGYDDV